MCIFAESEARTRGEHEGIERRREDKKGIKKKGKNAEGNTKKLLPKIKRPTPVCLSQRLFKREGNGLEAKTGIIERR